MNGTNGTDGTLARVARAVGPALAGVLCVAYHARDFVSSRGDLVFGDPYDGRLEVFLAEHWSLLFRGAATWRTPPFFHPFPGALGLSDAMFLFGVLQSVGRSLGLDTFAAFEVGLLATRVIGYVGMLLLLRRGLGVPLFESTVGAVLFTTFNLYTMQVGHPNVACTPAFLPWCLWLVLVFLRLRDGASAERRRIALLSGAAACALFSLVLYTSFYVTWFFVFSVAIGAVVAAVFSCVSRGARETSRRVARFVGSRRWDLALFGALLAVGAIPFAMTYLPVYRITGARHFDEVLLTELPDLVRAGPANWLWAGLLGGTGERFGYTVFVLAVFLAVVAFPRAWRSGFPAVRVGASTIDAALFARWAGVVFSVATLCTLHVGRVSPWRVVYRLLPAADAMRVTTRLAAVLAMLVVVVVSVGLAGLRARLFAGASPGLRRAGLLSMAIGPLLTLEQINTWTFSAIHRHAELARLDSIQAAPTTCRSFVLDSAPGQVPQTYFADLGQQVDAMLIAQRVGVPTMNGASGWEPPNWNVHPSLGDLYLPAAHGWAVANHVREGACVLAPSGRWRPLAEPIAFPLTLGFDLTGSGTKWLGKGWFSPEPWGVWSRARVATVHLPVPQSRRGLSVAIAARAPVHRARPRIVVHVDVDGVFLRDVVVVAGAPEITLVVPAARIGAADTIAVDFRFDELRSLKDDGVSEERRPITLGLVSLTATEIAP